MGKSDFFWQCIEKDIVNTYKMANPSEWEEKDINEFLIRMNEDLISIFRESDVKARKCGIPYIKGKYDLERWKFRVDIVTWRRYFKYDGNMGSIGSTKNQNCFAVVLGYDSARHYLENKIEEIKEDKNLENKTEEIKEDKNLENKTEEIKEDYYFKSGDVKRSQFSATNFKAGKNIDIVAKQKNSKSILNTFEARGSIKITIEQQQP